MVTLLWSGHRSLVSFTSGMRNIVQMNSLQSSIACVSSPKPWMKPLTRTLGCWSSGRRLRLTSVSRLTGLTAKQWVNWSPETGWNRWLRMNQHRFTALIQLKNAVPLFFSEEEFRVFLVLVFVFWAIVWLILFPAYLASSSTSNKKLESVCSSKKASSVSTGEMCGTYYSTLHHMVHFGSNVCVIVRIKLNLLCYLSIFSLYGSLRCVFGRILYLHSIVETRGVKRNLSKKDTQRMLIGLLTVPVVDLTAIPAYCICCINQCSRCWTQNTPRERAWKRKPFKVEFWCLMEFHIAEDTTTLSWWWIKEVGKAPVMRFWL